MPKRPKTDGGAEHPKKQEARIDRLLDIAAEVFLEEGFDGASVGTIARRAHASKETFYSRFATKEDLFQAAICRRLSSTADAFSAALVLEDPPAKALVAFGKVVLNRILTKDALALRRTIQMESVRFPQLARLFFDLGPGRMHTELIRYLEEHQLRGNLRKADARVAAPHLIGMMTSESLMWTLLGIHKKPTAREIAKKVQLAVDAFLRAYGVSSDRGVSS